jgi:hypothetical protein
VTARARIILRLALLPAAAAVVVIALSGITIRDLGDARIAGRRDAAPERKLIEKNESRAPARVPLDHGVPELSVEEALGLLDEGAPPPAVDRLWSLAEHREGLVRLLFKKDTPAEARLYLLERFEAEAPRLVLDAARSILKDPDLQAEPLILAACEILSREGDLDDLALLEERPGETHQLKSTREQRRDELRHRLERRAE